MDESVAADEGPGDPALRALRTARCRSAPPPGGPFRYCRDNDGECQRASRNVRMRHRSSPGLAGQVARTWEAVDRLDQLVGTLTEALHSEMSAGRGGTAGRRGAGGDLPPGRRRAHRTRRRPPRRRAGRRGGRPPPASWPTRPAAERDEARAARRERARRGRGGGGAGRPGTPAPGATRRSGRPARPRRCGRRPKRTGTRPGPRRGRRCGAELEVARTRAAEARATGEAERGAPATPGATSGRARPDGGSRRGRDGHAKRPTPGTQLDSARDRCRDRAPGGRGRPARPRRPPERESAAARHAQAQCRAGPGRRRGGPRADAAGHRGDRAAGRARTDAAQAGADGTRCGVPSRSCDGRAGGTWPICSGGWPPPGPTRTPHRRGPLSSPPRSAIWRPRWRRSGPAAAGPAAGTADRPGAASAANRCSVTYVARCGEHPNGRKVDQGPLPAAAR